jgi:uncharacterized protein (DUF924 family)
MKPDYSGPLSDTEKEVIDSKCREFSELIRACGRNELHGELWDSEKGIFAQVLLCDQLTRNSFRGTAEAFSLDPKAMELARQMFQDGSYKNLKLACFTFLTTPGQHSEALADHEMNRQIVAYMEER